MGILASLNLALAFALELAMLAAFAYFGYQAVDHMVWRWVLAIFLPLGAAGLWGVLLAPKATHRLPLVPGVVLALGMFLLAAFALYRSGQPTLALVMAVAAVLHAVLAVLWRQW